MIITKKWLEEWIDLEGISTEDICKKLNEIGLEVDGVKHQRIVDGVVVGFVKSCEKHPDAQKLSLCEVDIGSEVVQIVCGAPNVAKGQYVAVATVGTTLSNGLQIKPAKLRGVESNGMLCSSTELDLPKINDGIMLLDESIGELKLGDKLSQNSFLNDDVIEIGLTPNRGDCLGVRGVARDLAVAFKKELKEQKCIGEDENYLGIGRVLSLQVEGKLDSSFIYKVVSQEEIRGNLLIDLRLSAVEIKADDLLQKMVEYASYSKGILLRVYNKNSFEVNEERAKIVLKKGDSGFDLVWGKNGVVSHVGFNTNEKANKESKVVILEASFTPPELMAQLGANHKDLPPDKHLYRSARGSETQLELGIDCCLNLLCKNSDAKIYVGEQCVKSNIHVRNIVIDLDELNLIIGQ